MSANTNEKKIPAITVTTRTPYKVSNLENFYNSKGERLECTDVMFLCRCGKSTNKPFCDGSHGVDGIDGTRKPGGPKDKLRSFKGKEKNITIHDNRAVCSHDHACIEELPMVFDHLEKRWINPDGDEPEVTARVIKKCPSGALSYTIGDFTWTGGEEGREPAIKIAKNGPLEITGSIVLEDDQDSKPQMPEHYTLCRCGGSKNQPFCDGTHHKTGFEDDKN